MAVPTDPDDLQAAAACYCYAEETTLRVIIYLLANIAGLSATSPSVLATSAACYCYDEATMKRVMAYLLCQVANSGSSPAGGSGVTCGTANPVDAPTGGCGLYIRTDNGNVWYWDGAAWQSLVA